jgi:hypothetical protein
MRGIDGEHTADAGAVASDEAALAVHAGGDEQPAPRISRLECVEHAGAVVSRAFVFTGLGLGFRVCVYWIRGR